MTLEQLAAVQHDIWSHWMKHLFEVSIINRNGTVTIQADKVERWKRQMNTSYWELSHKEQASDIEQAIKVIEVLKDEC